MLMAGYDVLETKRRADALIADRARAYCAARHANRGASEESWWEALAEVDRTYYEMMRACGYFEGMQ